jgi:hypothetical protein
MKRIRSSILATIAYTDIFDFPLTGREVWYWLYGIHTQMERVYLTLYTLCGRTIPLNHVPNAVFTISGRKQIIHVRHRRFIWSKPKWIRAKFVARWLSIIPTVQLVGVTGGLALSNSDISDDIDFIIVVRSGYMWISRLAVIILTAIVAKRRKPGQSEVKNRICLNMFLSDNALALPKYKQDFYSAHELLQMRPLWEINGVYAKFLESNNWAREYYPNAWEERMKSDVGSRKPENNSTNRELRTKNIFSSLILQSSFFMLQILESWARKIQLWYMRKHQTTEVVTDTLLQFHPHDARVWVKKIYFRRLGTYKIPLDKRLEGLLK